MSQELHPFDVVNVQGRKDPDRSHRDDQGGVHPDNLHQSLRGSTVPSRQREKKNPKNQCKSDTLPFAQFLTN